MYSLVVLGIFTIYFLSFGLLFNHCFNIFGASSKDIYCDFYNKVTPILIEPLNTFLRPSGVVVDWIIGLPDKLSHP